MGENKYTSASIRKMCIGQAMVTQRDKAPPILLPLDGSRDPCVWKGAARGVEASFFPEVKMSGGHTEPANTTESHKHSFLKYTPTFSNIWIVKIKQIPLHPESLKLADSGPLVGTVK